MVGTKKQAGFTIIEIIVVIIVIGILASVSLVVYNNVTAKSRDAVRKQDLVNIAKLVQIDMLKNNSSTLTNCGGYMNAGSGWFNYSVPSNSGSYTKSIAECLNTSIIDPSKCTRSYTTSSCNTTYMLYTCPKDSEQTFNTKNPTPGETWTTVYTRIESMPTGALNFPKQVCFNQGNTTISTSYGMNYAINIGDPGSAPAIFPDTFTAY